MSDLPEVHWHEGLFVRPQHLQASQRHVAACFSAERRLAASYPWGVVDAQLSTKALGNARVQFDRLHAVLPSGQEVRVPDPDELPSIDISKAFSATRKTVTIYLAVPVYSPSRSNAIELSARGDTVSKRLFRVKEVMRADENTGEDPQPMLVRQVNAKLILDDEERSDLEVMPLVRVERSTSEPGAAPQLDTSFVPPTYHLRGSAILHELARDLIHEVETHRSSIAKRIRPGFSMNDIRGERLREFLKLSALSRAGGRLGEVLAARATTPFTMYLELRELLGELSALHPEREDLKIPHYDHDQPLLAFTAVCDAISRFLPAETGDEVKTFAFERGDKFFVCRLEQAEIGRAHEVYLRVTKGGDAGKAAALVTDRSQFKLMPLSQALTPIPGIPLEESRNPPQSLSLRGDFQYFRLLPAKNQRAWDKATEEKAVSIWWKELESSPMEFTLCLLFPAS